MRSFLIGALAAAGLLAAPGFCDLFTSVQVSARVDSDPYMLPGNVSATGFCYSTAFCNLTVASAPVSGNVFASIGAAYGSVSEGYSTDLGAPADHDGSVDAEFYARAIDTLTLRGGLDYQFVQVTFTGSDGVFETSSFAPPTFRLGSSSLSLPMHTVLDSLVYQTFSTPLLALPGTEFDFGLLLQGKGNGFAHPSPAKSLSLQMDSIQFFDSSQNPIADVLYSDASGSTYPIAGGVYTPDPAPEPSAIVLLATVLAVLAAVRFGRGRFRQPV